MQPLNRVALAPLLAVTLVATGGCRPPRPGTPVGMTLAPTAPTPLATLVWVGRGVAERRVAGGWQPAPAFDYEFTVEQRRYADHWDSVKTLRRYHPDYDGSAGPRVQVYLFRIDLTPGPTGVGYRVTSTLGAGRGTSDAEFREAAMELTADVSMFAPFDRYRITQRYLYEEGRLTELVELNDGAAPWVRNHEEARLFAAQRFAGPPTNVADAGTMPR